ncbi:hypothetical protein T06_13820 [Trichinella sp. T6]|nr:hypothetical protein T06_13820 [Trichinella sp. T6]
MYRLRYCHLRTKRQFWKSILIQIPLSLIPMIPMIHNYFLNTRVQGCYFRFCQTVLTKISELGLKKLSKR